MSVPTSPPPPPESDDGKHKDVVIPTRVAKETADKARKRAAKEKRSLSEILRSWLMLFAEGEAPSPPVMDDKRAPQRPPKKKKK